MYSTRQSKTAEAMQGMQMWTGTTRHVYIRRLGLDCGTLEVLGKNNVYQEARDNPLKLRVGADGLATHLLRGDITRRRSCRVIEQLASDNI